MPSFVTFAMSATEASGKKPTLCSHAYNPTVGMLNSRNKNLIHHNRISTGYSISNYDKLSPLSNPCRKRINNDHKTKRTDIRSTVTNYLLNKANQISDLHQLSHYWDTFAIGSASLLRSQAHPSPWFARSCSPALPFRNLQNMVKVYWAGNASHCVSCKN